MKNSKKMFIMAEALLTVMVIAVAFITVSYTHLDVYKRQGRNRVLDRISLDVRSGTVMGLMGENGAGKSTMMKCLFGTYQKDEGTIFLNGKEVSFSGPKDALENGIAMVHQELSLIHI